MIPLKFKECLEEIESWASTRKEVENIMVYGSVARGTAVEESDLDILLIAPRKRHYALARELYSIGNRHNVTVSPYLIERDDVNELDRQFIESLTRDGKVLKGEELDPTISDLDLKPHCLVTLFLDHLPQEKKMRLSRELYGYRSSRKYGRKKYESAKEGLLHRVNGRKLGRGTLLVPAKAWPELDELLRAYRGKRWAFTVWVQSP